MIFVVFAHVYYFCMDAPLMGYNLFYLSRLPLYSGVINKILPKYLIHRSQPIREEEISQVEMNEEFGLAGKMMLALLFQWLNAENRKAMDRLLRFYHPLDKAMLIYAMLLYVTTGKRVRMNNAVAQRHYNLMVEFVDDDMYTLPSHKHLMRLYEKYGLILPINETADGNL
jgi:hypothetical protein